MQKTMTITVPDGSFSAYVACPAAAPAPVIVVIQEIFGINADMRETCDKLASDGFVAICPDLYWRQEPGLELSDRTEAEWSKALALYKAFDVDAGISDLNATIEAVRHMPGASGKVGVMGYCLGGLLAYLTATRTEADANVTYYGVGIHERLDESKNIDRPYLMHIAEEDEFVPKSAQAIVRAGLKDKAEVEILTYPGLSHAFARNQGVHFDSAGAERANSRTLAFFKEHLAA